jgi:hypothetical protein
MYRAKRISKTPALRSLFSSPETAMAPNAVPLRSKCAASDAQGPPGQKSVITTLTGLPEQDRCLVHLT